MVSLTSLVLILLAAHVTRAALPCAVTITNSTDASPGKGVGCAFAWFDLLSDQQCRQAEVLLQRLSTFATVYDYEPASGDCTVEVLSACSDITFTDVIPVCNTTAEVEAEQGGLMDGLLPPTPGISYGGLEAGNGGGRSQGCCQGVTVGSQDLFLIETSYILTEDQCTAQGAFFALAEGRAAGVKSFYDIVTKLCISAAQGSCGDYGADVPECIGTGLQPSYAAYLQSRFDDIASRYLSGAPAPAPAAEAPRFGIEP